MPDEASAPGPGPEEPAVFVSHATSDRGVAELLVDYLERQGISCWIATRNILPGATYPGAIVEAIRSCRAIVVLVSKSAGRSPQVRRELERGVAYYRPILPVLLDDAPIPADIEYLIAGVHWLDATANLDGAMSQLATSLSTQDHRAILPAGDHQLRRSQIDRTPDERRRSLFAFSLMVFTLLMLAVPLAGLGIFFRDQIAGWARVQFDEIFSSSDAAR